MKQVTCILSFLLMVCMFNNCVIQGNKATNEFKYTIYSGGTPVLTIEPSDIEYCDTSQNRGIVEMHSIMLKENFYEYDSISLVAPVELICSINGVKYFWGDPFFRNQSLPRYHINFRFRPSCENEWKFNEHFNTTKDTLTINFQNKCNVIELFHMRNEIENNRTHYYNKQKSFVEYTDTARLAHEILFDDFYIKAMLAHGITLK